MSLTHHRGSFYLPTKVLTDGCLTVIRHCNCTCLMCVSTQTHTIHTFKSIFTGHGREEYKEQWTGFPLALKKFLYWPEKILSKAFKVFKNAWIAYKKKIAELFYIYETVLKSVIIKMASLTELLSWL